MYYQSPLILLSIATTIYSHGYMNFPISNPIKSSTQWFTDNITIPGIATLPPEFESLSKYQSYNTPWKAPGTAPVLGSGCGISGGAQSQAINRGPPVSHEQPYGQDGLYVPEIKPVLYIAGSVVEVMWKISANHGGGYSQRLCKNNGDRMPNEECFLQNTLKFYSNESWIAQSNGTRVAFNNPILNIGTYPKGSEWKRNPVPGCKLLCSIEKLMKCSQLPTSKEIFECKLNCSGFQYKDGLECPKSKTQFPEPLPGISGAGPGISGKEFDQSILDKVVIPQDLEEGKYMLSWRWDTEQTPQVWENCADILLKDEIERI